MAISPSAAARAVEIAQTAAVVVGGLSASSDAYTLYNQRDAMAAQMQQERMFPLDLISNTNRNFYISIGFQKYEKRNIRNQPFLRQEGTIRLPIPDNITDSTSVGYNTQNLGAAVGAGLETLTQNGLPGFDMQTLGNAIAAGTQFAAGAVAEEVSQTNIGRGLTNLYGLAVNPYQTVLFEKPEFKKHSFTWKLMPKNEQESGVVRDIIRIFQYHALPGIEDNNNGLFFSYPSMLRIRLFPSTEYLYRFKPCVLTNVTAKYASGSAPSFFKRSNAPTAITFSIQLQEIEYWVNRDYQQNTFFENNPISVTPPTPFTP
jgi:hypothetical protein